jgi:cytoskeleton protein RodZ
MLAQDKTMMGYGEQLGAAVGEELRALFNQLEAELHRSEGYCRAIAGLQSVAPSAPSLIQAVGREALRVAMQHFAPVAAPTAAAIVPSAAQSDHQAAAAHKADQDATQDAALFSAIADVMAPTPTKARFSFLPQRPTKLSAAEIALQEQTARHTQLRQLGQQLRQAREAKAMTLAQLHTRSFVPMYHLQALEMGRVDNLPEDVYLRGFLRRLENVLGLTVGTLQANLPTNLVQTSIAPSWSAAKPTKVRAGLGGLQVNSAHLYVTYASLMAGGVFWLSNQTSPKANFTPITIDNPHTEAAKVPSKADSATQSGAASNMANRGAKKSPSAKVSQQPGAGVKVSIAPPEMLRQTR